MKPYYALIILLTALSQNIRGMDGLLALDEELNQSQSELNLAMFSLMDQSDPSIEELERLINEGADVNATQDSESTDTSGINNAHKRVRVSKTNGHLKFREKKKTAETILECAAINGHLSLYNELIKKGANKIDWEWVFFKALDKNHLEICKQLLEDCPSKEIKNWSNQLLSLAAQKSLYSLCETLINNGIEVNAKKPKGLTIAPNGPKSPLMFAAQADSLGICKLLVNKGAQVNYISANNKIALEYATTEEVFTFLKEKTPKDLLSPEEELIIATKNKFSDDLTSKLIDKCNDLNTCDNFSQSALTYAVRQGNIPLCKLLIKKGAHVHEDDIIAATSLKVKNGRQEIADLLVKHTNSNDIAYWISSYYTTHPRNLDKNTYVKLAKQTNLSFLKSFTRKLFHVSEEALKEAHDRVSSVLLGFKKQCKRMPKDIRIKLILSDLDEILEALENFDNDIAIISSLRPIEKILADEKLSSETKDILHKIIHVLNLQTNTPFSAINRTIYVQAVTAEMKNRSEKSLSVAVAKILMARIIHGKGIPSELGTSANKLLKLFLLQNVLYDNAQRKDTDKPIRLLNLLEQANNILKQLKKPPIINLAGNLRETLVEFFSSDQSSKNKKMAKESAPKRRKKRA